MSSPTGVPDDDAYWQRPASGAEASGLVRPAPAPRRVDPPYAGPPRVPPPPPDWRPPLIAEPPPPRSMPAQNLPALDEDERSARTVTYGVGLVAGAIALILMLLLCARAIF